jgi:hypothetical protein
VILAVIAIVLGVGALVGIALLTSSGSTEVRLGDDEFEVGEAATLAALIDRDGAPLLFQDLLVGGSRDIYVNHVGDDAEIGWVAFDARLPGSGRECTLVWEVGREVFLDPCTDDTFPADGGDLPHYPIRVTDDGALVVDLTPQGVPGQGSTTTGSSSSSILVTGLSTTTTEG